MGKSVLRDIFLLCSDGLTDMLYNHQIQDVLNSDKPIRTRFFGKGYSGNGLGFQGKGDRRLLWSGQRATS
jgi:hypothetical protein